MDLPEWATGLRPLQKVAVMQILRQFEDNDVVVLEAPTGTGKTLIGEVVRQEMGKRGLYVCSSLQLQDQFLHDFPYAKVLKGRSNYPTALYPEKFNEYQQLSCADCIVHKVGDEMRCDWCGTKDQCPYEDAKNAALGGELAVVNSSYFLTEANGPGRFSNRPLVVWDECDTAEQDLMRHVEVVVPKYLGVGEPKFVTKPESWAEWLVEAVPQVEGYRDNLSRKTTKDLKVRRQVKRLNELLGSMRAFGKGLESEDVEWIMQVENERVSFRPVKVDSLGKEMIWRHGRKWLLMSATVISPDLLLENLGWTGTFGFVKLPSTFKVENRRIVPKPVANMSKKAQEANPNELMELLQAVRQILVKHPNERILVHSVSYKLTDNIVDAISGNCRAIFSYTKARDKQAALEGYLNTPGGVLVGPSLDRGVDLPGDACRVQVLVKVPFPSLGDKQIARRVWTKGGQAWYTVETIRTLVQMTGRAVRSETDYAVTYILDSQFTGLVTKNRNLVPRWWADGIDWRAS